MKIAFRVDASFEIGSGHLMRCLTLGKALRARGIECLFLSREREGNLNELLKSQGFDVRALPTNKESSQRSDQPLLTHSHWLGVNWLTDARQTIEALGDGVFDWLIVDHYALDKRWESELRPHVKKIMVIDDLADREHDCDLLLDQNLVVDFETRYNQFVAPICARLLGPRYALLQPEYAELRSRTLPRTGPVRRIFVYFGGSDLHNLTGLVISAFLNLQRKDLLLDVVVNSNSPNADRVRSQVVGHTNITLQENAPSLAPLMAKADLAIGAGGATTWERCCLGLPAIVITLAENQTLIADTLSKKGLIRWVGDHETVTVEILSQAIDQALDGHSLCNWSMACSDIIDGKGADRIVSALTLAPSIPLKLRVANLADERLLLDWANDPLVRRHSFTTSQIHPDTHRQWFGSRLENLSGCRLYIAETQDELPIGQVRFEHVEGGDWEIHYGLWAGARGKGLGIKIVKLALEKLRTENPVGKVVGCVKPDNAPSRRIFEALGFSAHHKETETHLVYALDFKHKAFRVRV